MKHFCEDVMENNKELPNRIKNLLAYINRMLSGKEEAVRLTLISAVAGENILLLGPSALDKSILVRCVARAFQKNHEPDRDNLNKGIRKLKDSSDFYSEDFTVFQHDRFEYCIRFLNDIWAGNPGKLQDPHIFFAADSKEADPYKTAENRGLEILRECFALHVQVTTASSDEAFFKFVENPDNYIEPDKTMYNTLLISESEIKKWRTEIDKVKLSNDAKNLISEIRKKSFEYFISDFRWRKIVRVLKTCAFLNGRNEVDLIDCSLIDYAIPDHVVETILKQKAINQELDKKKHPQYKENIFVQQKYYNILKASIADKKLELEKGVQNPF